MSDRYIWSSEGFYVDITRPWIDPDADEDPEDPEEQLFEEIDAGEVLNDQAANIVELEAALGQVQAELTVIKAKYVEVCGYCQHNYGSYCHKMDRFNPKDGRCFVHQPCHFTPSCWAKRGAK